MEPSEYQELSFQQFRERYSTNEPAIPFVTGRVLDLFGSSPGDFLYIVHNERRIAQIRQELARLAPADFYLGVIGGVLANFDYFTAVASEGSPILLTDLNDRAIDHLAFVCYCAQELKGGDAQDNKNTFLDNLANRPLDEGRSRELFGIDSKGRTVDFSLYQDPQKREIIAREFARYFQSLRPEEVVSSWLTQPQLINRALGEGRIKAYRGDLFNGGNEVAREVLVRSKSKRPLIYLSDIRNGKIRELLERLVGGIELEGHVVENQRVNPFRSS